MNKDYKNYFYSIIFLFLSLSVVSQEIKGYVYEAKTNYPLPYVSVSVKGTTIGTTTTKDGYFKLKVEKLPCKIDIRFLGYIPVEKTIKDTSTVIIKIKEDVQLLDEIIIKPNYSYDKFLLKKIIANREKNDPDLLQNITYNDYCRTSIFITGIKNNTIEKSKILSKSASAFVQETDSTVRMPFLIVEQLFRHIRGKNSRDEEISILKDTNATILSGISKEIKSVVLDKITTEFNFYNNQINVLARGIPSPIGINSFLDYNTYLSDSVIKDDIKQYKFNFYPKDKKSLSFKGYFWATSDGWAITEIHAIVPNNANINFVSDMVLDIFYQKTPHEQWFYKSQSVKMNLSIISPDSTDKKTRTFAVKKLNTFLIELPSTHDKDTTNNKPLKYLDEKISQEEILSKIRIPLDSFENAAFNGINTFHNNGYFKFADKLSYLAMFGYYNIGYIDIGPHYLFYHNNKIEGHRFSIPIRTSYKTSKDLLISGYLGFGSLNQQFAYGGSIAYKFKSKRRAIIWFNTRYDYFELTHNKFIEFIKEQPSQQGSGNLISPITTYNPNPYMIRSRMFNITLEKDFNRSAGMLIRPKIEIFENNKYLNLTAPEKQDIKNFTIYSLMLNLRLSHDQSFDEEFFTRIYYGNGLPVYNISAIIGYFNINSINNKGQFLNINFSIKQRIDISNRMLFLYLIESGGTIGNVPFPLLNMPHGCMDLGSARYHFNLLYNTSFVSDIYTSIHLHLNTYGMIFNHIPLIKKFNLREIFSFKCYYGKLLNKNKHNEILIIPEYLREPTKTPYMEASFGIDNIFKCFQIEYAFRLNKGKEFNEFSARHGIRMKFEIRF